MAAAPAGKDEDADNYEALQAADRSKGGGGGSRPPITLSEDKVIGVWCAVPPADPQPGDECAKVFLMAVVRRRASNDQFDGKKWAIVNSDDEEDSRREAEEAEVRRISPGNVR